MSHLPATLPEATEYVRKCRETLLRAELGWAQRVNAELADLRVVVQEAETHLEDLTRIIPRDWKGNRA